MRLNRQLDASFKKGLLPIMGALSEVGHPRDLRLVLCGVADLKACQNLLSSPLRSDENSGELVGTAESTQRKPEKPATAHGGCRFHLPTGGLAGGISSKV